MIVSCIFYNTVNAQDYLFSPFFNTPLSQNPALTAKFREDYRFGGAYRNQWNQINAAFATTGIFADINFRRGLDNPDKFGVGIQFNNDELGDLIYSNQYYQISGAYHKVLDRLKRHRLSAGVQVGYVYKSLNMNKLTFANQYTDWNYNNNPSGENMLGNTMGYASVNAGLFWDFTLNPRLDIYLGGSLFNINQPKEQLISYNKNNQLGIRQNYTIGSNYMLSKNISILPAVQITRQTKAMDINIGGALGYSIVSGKLDRSTVQLGMWYRAKDAVIVYGGIKFRNYLLGLSYDMTASGLNDIKNAPNIGRTTNIGAFEITFIKVGFLNRAIPNDLTVPCRFF